MDATPPTLDAADTWLMPGAFITKGSLEYLLVMLACTFSITVMKKTKRKRKKPATGMEVTTKSIGSRTPHFRSAENSARHSLHGLPSEAKHVVTERVAWCHAGELDGGEEKKTVRNQGGVMCWTISLNSSGPFTAVLWL